MFFWVSLNQKIYLFIHKTKTKYQIYEAYMNKTSINLTSSQLQN